MHNKVVVITGATSGLGEAAATELARQGARIVLIARNRQRGEATLARLREIAPGIPHSIHYADLSLVADTKRVASEIAAAEPRIDVLVNNAGLVCRTRQLTSEGLERTFATNHLAYFVLTLGLYPSLRAAGKARVVSTASGAHKTPLLDFDDLQYAKRYSAIGAYGGSKLCNILFTRELTRRWANRGIDVNCLHPGFVATRLADDQASGLLMAFLRLIKSFAITPEKGAETVIYLASSPDVVGQSGGYYFRCRLTTPSARARSDAEAKRLWEQSVRITGINTD